MFSEKAEGKSVCIRGVESRCFMRVHLLSQNLKLTAYECTFERFNSVIV